MSSFYKKHISLLDPGSEQPSSGVLKGDGNPSSAQLCKAMQLAVHMVELLFLSKKESMPIGGPTWCKGWKAEPHLYQFGCLDKAGARLLCAQSI